MSLRESDLLKVIPTARDVSQRAGVSLDAEIISAQYNAYMASQGREYEYEMCELQVLLDKLIQRGELNGCVTRLSGVIAKVIVL
ncbi:hypothetical protein D3C81_1850240 [compost metagenome]